MTCNCKHSVNSIMDSIHFWKQCGQVLPKKARKQFSNTIGQLLVHGNVKQVSDEMNKILKEHDVKIVIRSKYAEVDYQERK